jgi:hypothetical protein
VSFISEDRLDMSLYFGLFCHFISACLFSSCEIWKLQKLGILIEETKDIEANPMAFSGFNSHIRHSFRQEA